MAGLAADGERERRGFGVMKGVDVEWRRERGRGGTVRNGNGRVGAGLLALYAEAEAGFAMDLGGRARIGGAEGGGAGFAKSAGRDGAGKGCERMKEKQEEQLGYARPAITRLRDQLSVYREWP